MFGDTIHSASMPRSAHAETKDSWTFRAARTQGFGVAGVSAAAGAVLFEEAAGAALSGAAACVMQRCSIARMQSDEPSVE